PENIILADGRACVLDFGLARALSEVDTERLTASGLAVGTPHYLSPEQAAAEKDVGPKADQYALACVLYEMLVGEPPFTGPTASAIAMRHIAEEAKPLRLRRHTTPTGVEAAVMRALEKVPGDRFGSVGDFAVASRAVTSSVPVDAQKLANHSRSRRWTVAVAAVLMAGAGAALAKSDLSASDALDDGVRWLMNTSLDTARIAVFSAEVHAPHAVDLAMDERLGDALAQWKGVSVVGTTDVNVALEASPSAPLAAHARTLARSLRAGRYIILSQQQAEQRYRLRAEMIDVRTGKTISSVMTSLPPGNTPDSVVAHLAYVLLFPRDEEAASEDAMGGTRNRLAFDHYLAARAAVSTWNLPQADSEYAVAVRADPNFPQATLGLAYVRSWSREDAPDVATLVSRTLDGTARLTERQRHHAAALKSLRASHFHDACVDYGHLLASDSVDFAAWYGLGTCNLRDKAVVKDPASPSGWRFRGSRQRAVWAIGRAFDLLPRINECCVERADRIVRRPLITDNAAVVVGYGLGKDATRYGAYPALDADTLALVPYPLSAMTSAAPPASRTSAVQQQREIFFRIASRRASLYPQSADALEELGQAMELRSDRATIDTIRRSRRLATDPSQALRLAVTETWLRLKFALPGALGELRNSRALADSLLLHSPAQTAEDARLLASLAALVGDATRSASLAARSPSGDDEMKQAPDEVLATARAFLAYAALGGPADSLRYLDARLVNGIANAVLPEHRQAARQALIGQPASLAYPVYRSQGFADLDPGANDLIAAEVAHGRGDTASVRRILAASARARSNVPAADLTLDALYPEAWLLASIGDSDAALRTIGPTLDALRHMPVRQLMNLANAGTLVPAMTLRAELAFRKGHGDEARLWARGARMVTDTTLAGARALRQTVLALAR
ncbi:MAG: protein kinase, partial [Gemmatimonadetes bacterium]|nr:protein kinase [Gemmatimonadota bacterium]